MPSSTRERKKRERGKRSKKPRNAKGIYQVSLSILPRISTRQKRQEEDKAPPKHIHTGTKSNHVGKKVLTSVSTEITNFCLKRVRRSKIKRTTDPHPTPSLIKIFHAFASLLLFLFTFACLLDCLARTHTHTSTNQTSWCLCLCHCLSPPCYVYICWLSPIFFPLSSFSWPCTYYRHSIFFAPVNKMVFV